MLDCFFDKKWLVRVPETQINNWKMLIKHPLQFHLWNPVRAHLYLLPPVKRLKHISPWCLWFSVTSAWRNDLNRAFGATTGSWSYSAGASLHPCQEEETLPTSAAVHSSKGCTNARMAELLHENLLEPLSYCTRVFFLVQDQESHYSEKLKRTISAAHPSCRFTQVSDGEKKLKNAYKIRV